MKQNPLLIAIGAGLTSAILFMSVATGTLLAVFLGNLAALPLIICALGWGIKPGIIASLGGAAVVALIHPIVALYYVVFIAAPVMLLSYLAALNRPAVMSETASPQHEATLEWYPLDRLLVWIAILAIGLAIIYLFMIATNYADYQKNLQNFLDTLLKNVTTSPDIKITKEQLEKFKTLLILSLPALLSTGWFVLMLFNFWLGAKITKISGLLQRPWPDLAEIELPVQLTFVFVAALLLNSFTSGYLYLITTAVTGGLFALYIFAGLSVVHYIARPSPYKVFILAAFYLLFFVLNPWASLAVAIIGFGEPLFHLRRFGKPPSSGAQGST